MSTTWFRPSVYRRAEAGVLWLFGRVRNGPFNLREKQMKDQAEMSARDVLLKTLMEKAEGGEHSGVNYMPMGEFVSEGLLQELNRTFLHPVGLAMEITMVDGTAVISGIWDYRDDPEGMCFAEGTLRQLKFDQVQAERDRHADARRAIFGSTVQPLPYPPNDPPDVASMEGRRSGEAQD